MEDYDNSPMVSYVFKDLKKLEATVRSQAKQHHNTSMREYVLSNKYVGHALAERLNDI